MRKIKFDANRSKQQFRKIRKRTWFKPASIILTAAFIAILIFFSATLARYSANSKITRISAERDVDYAASSGENNDAYDIYYDDEDKTSKESGKMVRIGNLYDRIKGDDTSDREVEITSEADNGTSNTGMVRELAELEKRITDSVLSQIDTQKTEVPEVVAGKDGQDGEKGERGEAGPRGAAGPAGITGATGKPGIAGATGEKGDTGEAGKDGLSTFIVYADTVDGKNMSMTPKETSKFIGTYQGTIRSSDPKDYTWTEYKDKIITYTNDDGKPTIHIFN